MSPTTVEKEEKNRLLRENAFSLGIWGVMMFVMLFLTYLIMSSNLIKQAREFGIYRCIGVKKSNIAYYFCVENMVGIALTSVLGTVITSGVLLFIQNGRFGPALSDTIYYPLYFGAAIIIFFFFTGMITGLLLITRFLKRDPGDIMSQLDV